MTTVVGPDKQTGTLLDGIEALSLSLQSSRKSTGKYRLYCNLGYNLNEDSVKDYFHRFCTQGRILDVYIPRHSSGRNKGYGFTTFQSEADLDNALKSTEHLIEGTVVKVNRAGPRPDNQVNNDQDEGHNTQAKVIASLQAGAAYGRGPRLYVGGVPDHITEEQIMKHFKQWGTVVDIYFPGKRGQKRVNYCFVTFDDWLAAQRACKETDCKIDGEMVKSISIAEERAILPQQLQPLQAPHPDLPGYSLGYDPSVSASSSGAATLAALQQMAAHSLENTARSSDALAAQQWQAALGGVPSSSMLSRQGVASLYSISVVMTSATTLISGSAQVVGPPLPFKLFRRSSLAAEFFPAIVFRVAPLTDIKLPTLASMVRRELGELETARNALRKATCCRCEDRESKGEVRAERAALFLELQQHSGQQLQASLLQAQLPQQPFHLASTSMQQRLMPELHAGVHDLRVSPSIGRSLPSVTGLPQAGGQLQQPTQQHLAQQAEAISLYNDANAPYWELPLEPSDAFAGFGSPAARQKALSEQLTAVPQQSLATSLSFPATGQWLHQRQDGQGGPLYGYLQLPPD